MSFLKKWSVRAREVREALGLARQDMAGLLQVTPGDVEAWEGEQPPGPQELERYARLLGLELEELFEGGVPPQNLVRALFRSAKEAFDNDSAFHPNDLMPLSAALPVGAFLRDMRRVERLESALGRGAGLGKLEEVAPSGFALSRLEDPQARRNAALEGGALAHEAREVLGLGDAPIPSMVEFLEGLGVWVFASAALPLSLDAAATRACGAGVLVREGSGASRWRLRVTLAHELCHLLHDRAALGGAGARGFLGVSPNKEQVWSGVLRVLELMEVRARSFGASFVAPLSGVKALLGACPTDEAGSKRAIGAVCAHFGVGKTVAINQLCNAFFESDKELWGQTRARFLGLSGVPGPHFAGREVLHEAHRHPRFVRLVLEGLEEGVLSRAEGWEYLGRSLGEPLVEDVALTTDPRWLRPFAAQARAAEKWSA